MSEAYPHTLEVEPTEAGLTADGLPHVGGPAADDADRFVHLHKQMLVFFKISVICFLVYPLWVVHHKNDFWVDLRAILFLIIGLTQEWPASTAKIDSYLYFKMQEKHSDKKFQLWMTMKNSMVGMIV